MFCPADVHDDLSQFLKQKKDRRHREDVPFLPPKVNSLDFIFASRKGFWHGDDHVRCADRPVCCSLLYVFMYNWSSKHWLVLHDVAHRSWTWRECIVKPNPPPGEQDRLTRFFDSIGFRSVFSNFSFLEQVSLQGLHTTDGWSSWVGQQFPTWWVGVDCSCTCIQRKDGLDGAAQGECLLVRGHLKSSHIADKRKNFHMPLYPLPPSSNESVIDNEKNVWQMAFNAKSKCSSKKKNFKK